MKRVSEKEFNRFLKKYPGVICGHLEMSADPPILIFQDKETGEVVGRCLEVSLGTATTYKDAYYEINEVVSIGK